MTDDLHWLVRYVSPIVLLCILAACVWIIYCLNRKTGNTYWAGDLLLNAVSGKADLDKHVLIGMALVSLWVIVVKTMGLYKGEDVSTLLLGVLGIFVIKRGADNYTASRANTTTASTTTIERTEDKEMQTSVETTKGDTK